MVVRVRRPFTDKLTKQKYDVEAMGQEIVVPFARGQSLIASGYVSLITYDDNQSNDANKELSTENELLKAEIVSLKKELESYKTAKPSKHKGEKE